MTSHKYEPSKNIFPLIGFPKCGPVKIFFEIILREYWIFLKVSKQVADRKKNILKKNGENMIDMSEIVVVRGNGPK